MIFLAFYIFAPFSTAFNTQHAALHTLIVGHIVPAQSFFLSLSLSISAFLHYLCVQCYACFCICLHIQAQTHMPCHLHAQHFLFTFVIFIVIRYTLSEECYEERKKILFKQEIVIIKMELDKRLFAAPRDA